METVTLRPFKYKKRDFLHTENGWCVRQVTRGSELLWKVFYGYLPPGAPYPGNPTEYADAGEFYSKEEAVEWVLKRRKLR